MSEIDAGDREGMREVLAGLRDGGETLEALGRAWAIDINQSGLLTMREREALPAEGALPVFSCDTRLEAWAILVGAGIVRAHPTDKCAVVVMTEHESTIGYYVSPNGGYYLREDLVRRRGVLKVEDLPRITRALAQERLVVLERVQEAEAMSTEERRREALERAARRWEKMQKVMPRYA